MSYDDNYDEYEEIDDAYPEPSAPTGPVGDAETLLRRVIDIIADAPTMPLSFVAKTRREADELLEAARVRAERMVQRTEVVRAAEQRARTVMETADADSRRLKHETEDFLDQRLGSFEILLDKLQKTVNAGRQRLSIGDPQPDATNTGGLPVIDDSLASNAFFDQDH